MPSITLTEYQANILGYAIRRGIKKLITDKAYIEKFYGNDAQPEVFESKDMKIKALRQVAEKLRFELDI